MRTSMKTIRIKIIAAFFAFFIAGCGSGSKVAGPCTSGFNIQFRITSVKEGLPLDSLSLSIAIGKDGTEQKFDVNLKTGVSSANITATQGQPYKLVFKLFSAGHKIGEGTASDVLSCGLDVELNPVWDTVETGKVKIELNQGTLLPTKLSVFFTQAVAGKNLELPLDSLSKGVYRWYVKLASGDSINLANPNLIEGEGPVVRFLVPDSLAGKQIVLRLQIVIDGKIKEERIWMISVLGTVAKDRLSRITVRVDSGDKQGASQSLGYTDGRVTLVQYYDTLTPTKDQKPSNVDSLYYDDKGRLTKKSSLQSDSTRIDSLFTYNADGKLSTIEYRKGSDIVIDSLTYLDGKLSTDIRSTGGKRVERIRFIWTGTQKRIDSVFAIDTDGDKWKRFIENTYKNDSLIERRTSQVQGGLQPMSKEVIAYNALGDRAYLESYTEGASLTLDHSEAYGYDAKGRRVSMRIKDDVTGANLHFYQYEYSLPPAAKGAAAWMANRSTANSIELASILTDIRSAYASLDIEPVRRSYIEGNK